MRLAIPDFQLMIEVNTDTKPRMIPKWVGEVSFTVPASKTRDHLKEIVASKATVDLAFMFSIQESPKWESPNVNTPRAQQLHAEPLVDYDAFDPTVAIAIVAETCGRE